MTIKCPQCKREYSQSVQYCRYCSISLRTGEKIENQLIWTKKIDIGDHLGIIVCCILGILGLVYFSFINKGDSNTKPVQTSSKSTSCYVAPKPEPWSCTSDCSGHQAGYTWANRNNILNPMECTGNSASFIEGCEYYVQEYTHDTSLERCLDEYSNNQQLEYENNRDEEYRFEP